MKRLIASVILSAISLSAMADNSGKYYISGDYGKLSLSNTIPTNPSAVLPNPKAMRLGVGYHFTPSVAVEAGYVAIGDSTLVAPNDSVTLKQSAIQLAAVGSYQLNSSFDVIAKLGLSANSNKFTGTGLDAGLNTSNSSTSLIYGIGIQFNINEQIGIRAQYEDFGKTTVSENFGNTSWKMGVKMTSIGVVYNF